MPQHRKYRYTLTPANHEFWWLVGLLEGEGSFQKAVPAKTFHDAKIDFKCTDLDTMKRASTAMGGSSILTNKPVEPHHKPQYRVQIVGTRAIQIMRMIKPHMSKRRQGQIAKVLDSVPEDYGLNT